MHSTEIHTSGVMAPPAVLWDCTRYVLIHATRNLRLSELLYEATVELGLSGLKTGFRAKAEVAAPFTCGWPRDGGVPDADSGVRSEGSGDAPHYATLAA